MYKLLINLKKKRIIYIGPVPRVQAYIDDGGDYHTMYKLIYQDMQGQYRSDVVEHIKQVRCEESRPLWSEHLSLAVLDCKTLHGRICSAHVAMLGFTFC